MYLKKIILLSGARHGTHYISNLLNTNKVSMNGESFSSEKPTVYLNIIKKELSKHNIELYDKDIEYISTLRYKDEKLFFYKMFDFYIKLGLLNKQVYTGFKVFYDHLNKKKINSNFFKDFSIRPDKIEITNVQNPLSLIDLVNYVDKIIVLSRDSKEVAFSLAQALNNKLWYDKFRDCKEKNLILDENNTNTVNSILYSNFNFFRQIKELPKEQPDKFLFLNYDEFSTNAFYKIEDFLKTKIDKTLNPFKKNHYDYYNFFKNHPTIKDTAEKYNTIF
jgi:hypothetical protein